MQNLYWIYNASTNGIILSNTDMTGSMNTYDVDSGGILTTDSTITSNVTRVGVAQNGYNPFTGGIKLNHMFNGFTALENVDLSNLQFDTDGYIAQVNGMFLNTPVQSVTIEYLGIPNHLCDASGMFSYLTSTSLSLNIYTRFINNMTSMFEHCENLESLDLSDFNTSNVTNMTSMFTHCKELASLDISSFDTSNVQNMGYMFSYCYKLTALDLSSFDTSNVQNMGYMFSYCYKLTALDLSSFDTSNVQNMEYMFSFCYELTALDLSTFNTSAVTGMDSMFRTSNKIKAIFVSDQWTVDNVSSSTYMFTGCISLEGAIPYNSPYTDKRRANVTTGYLTLKHDEPIPGLIYFSISSDNATLTLNGLWSSKTTRHYTQRTDPIDDRPWANVKSSITNIHPASISDPDIIYLTKGFYFFEGTKVTSINTSFYDTSNVTDMQSMFANCTSLQNIDFYNFDTSNVTNMQNMFYKCTSLSSIDVSSFDTSKVELMNGMFRNVGMISNDLDLSNFNTSNVRNMASMFEANLCASVDVSSFDTRNVTNMSNMFSNTLLSSIDVSSFDTSNVTDMHGMFAYSPSLTELNLSNFNTSKVETFGSTASGNNGMFQEDSSLVTLDITNFTIDSCTVTKYMFSGCTSLKTIFIKDGADWNVASLTDSTDMFINCTSIKGENGTTYSTSHKTKDYARIDKAGQAGYFTRSRRYIDKTIVGDGELIIVGAQVPAIDPLDTHIYYLAGKSVTITAKPSDADYSYLHDLTETNVRTSVTRIVTDIHTAFPYTYTIDNLIDNFEITANFNTRQEHTLTAVNEQSYDVLGTGTYRYLDEATLLTNVLGIVSFLGWWEASTYPDSSPLSTQNPYSFVMPDNDLNLISKCGPISFTDDQVRQFIIRNGYGEVYNLTKKGAEIFLNAPKGLGYKKTVEQVRYGNTSKTINEQYEFPSITGELIFINEDNSTNYDEYHDFITFLTRKPLTLYMKVPLKDIPGEERNKIFYIPFEPVSIEKNEADHDAGYLPCSFQFQGTSFWISEEKNITIESVTLSVTNNSHFDTGVYLELSRALASSTFKNPTIVFKDTNTNVSGVEYGRLPLHDDSIDINKIVYNSKDGEQSIKLYDSNGDLIGDAFTYFNFSDSNLNSDIAFPYIKLKQGNNKIEFTYESTGSSDEQRKYFLIFDEAYISV